MNKLNWFITQEQIAIGKVDDVVSFVDPAVISNDEIYGLAGMVRLRVEGVTKPADIFANAQARKFFQQLNADWPWAGYFLRLHPVTVASPIEQIIDTSLFMALLFCRLDELTYVETERGVTLRFDGSQFKRHLADLRQQAAALASLTGYPDTSIQQRDNKIMEAVASFFTAGQSANKASNRRRKSQS